MRTVRAVFLTPVSGRIVKPAPNTAFRLIFVPIWMVMKKGLFVFAPRKMASRKVRTAINTPASVRRHWKGAFSMVTMPGGRFTR